MLFIWHSHNIRNIKSMAYYLSCNLSQQLRKLINIILNQHWDNNQYIPTKILKTTSSMTQISLSPHHSTKQSPDHQNNRLTHNLRHLSSSFSTSVGVARVATARGRSKASKEANQLLLDGAPRTVNWHCVKDLVEQLKSSVGIKEYFRTLNGMNKKICISVCSA